MNIVCSDGKGWVVIPFTFYLLPHKKGFKMIGALWTGISGLSSHQKALDNEATNIANVNTVGYKASRISFADQMYQDKIGKGSKVLDAEKLYTQGNLKVTGVSFDMALSGQGFFTVSDTRSSGSSETYYARAGNFRMGEDGTLQDAAGNKVQGWAMADVDSDTDVKTTNPNITYFTNDYTKLAASKIIRHNNKIETITAKMTDYTLTATADASSVFTGAGYKTKSGKISDVEALISEYNTKLTAYQSDPSATSSPSTAQVSYIRFPLDSTASGDGDQMYVYINGTKYSQSFDTDYATTMKKLADQISAIPGFKAYTAAGASGSIAETTDDTALNTALTGGALKIESLIPGKIFTVGEVAETSGSTTSVGSVVSTQGTSAVIGTGFGAVKSAQEALLAAVSGQQRDVYTTTDIGTMNGTDDYTYQISIYNADTKANIDVPTVALAITDPADIDDIIADINADASLSTYVVAKNVNGAMVVEVKPEYAGYSINGSLENTTTTTVIEKNSAYSGWSGAGAEFIQMINTVDQTASQDSLQLRLDVLNISDSAFGEFSVDSSGLITMKQDGAEFAIGQVAIALFNNERGLIPIGDNLVTKSNESGEPIFNINNDKTAKIEGKTLELSTADLSESLVNLMVFQRAFEANAKSITTSDELLNTLINLKR
ncbi:MAG: flagellar hook-basal body complex protein [Arcobacteraceae bacterium]